MKTHLLHGIIAGILSALAGIIYMYLYQELNFVNFGLVINAGSIFGSSMLGCLLMSTGYFLLDKFNKPNLRGVLNLIIMLLTFLSIAGPLSMSLPLEIDFPELFPALVLPMHFFPAMIFFGIVPFFKRNQ